MYSYINKACTMGVYMFMRDTVRDGQTLRIRSVYFTVWPASRHDIKNAIMHASGQVKDDSRSESVRWAHTSGTICIKLSVPISPATQSSVFQPYNKNALFQDGLNYRGTFWRHEFVHETMMRSHVLALLQPMLVTRGLQCPSQ